MRSISSGGNPMSEAEMDAHTIRNMREQSTADGQPPKTLVALTPTDSLKDVIKRLFQNRCSMAPVLTWDTHGKILTSLPITSYNFKLACSVFHVKHGIGID